MAITSSLGLPNGFVWELAGQQDPVAAFEAMTQVARTAEASGCETIWASDHLMTVPLSQSMVFECWTSVAALLRDTETLRVGQLMTCNNYHNPALSAKMMIAGSGEKVTLKLVGKYGDLCNVVGDPAEVARKFAVLKGHAEAAARVPQWAPAVFPGDISTYGLIGTVETVRQWIEAYDDAGVQELIVSFPNTYDLDVVRQFAREFIK